MKSFVPMIFLSLSQAKGDTSGVLNLDSGSTGIEKKYNKIQEIEPSVSKTDFFFLSQKEFWLAITVLFCLILIIGFEIWLIKTKNFTPDSSIRLIVITLVIMGSLFLIMSGYNDHIVAPAFGLFGTIAGYLFGRTEKNSGNDKPQQ